MPNFSFGDKIEVAQVLEIPQTWTFMILKKNEIDAKLRNSASHNDISMNKVKIQIYMILTKCPPVY